MTEMTITPEMHRRIVAEFMPRAVEFANNSGGMMRTMAIRANDPEGFPGQEEYVVHGNPLPVETVDYIASTVVPTFTELSAGLSERSPDAIDKTGQLLAAGKNVNLVTSHGNLIDPAIALAAVSNQLRSRGYEFEMGISLGKMLAILEHKIDDGQGNVGYMPMVGVLKWLCNETYLSIPRSDTTKKSPLMKKMPEEVKAYNRLVKEAMLQRLGEGGMLLAVAASGTTDKESDSSTHTVMGRVNDGTIDVMMAHDATFVQPVAMDIDGDKPFMELCEQPKQLSRREEAHEVMEGMASWLTDKLEDGREVLYQAAAEAAEKIAKRKNKD